MKGKTVQFDSESHLAVQLLLPWYVIGRLDGADRARVESHLGDCPRCCADVAWQRKLHARHLAGASVEPRAVVAPFVVEPRPAASPPRPVRRCRADPPAAWRWTPALQWAAIFAVALLLLVPRPPETRYLVPGTAAPVANLVVAFRATATEQQIRQALRDSSARVVDGPTAADTYLLSVEPAQRGSALERLRGEPAVAHADTVGRRPMR